jgi:hypothetical protein
MSLSGAFCAIGRNLGGARRRAAEPLWPQPTHFWTVHQRLADTKPTTDLCRIGTTAVVRKLITLYHQRRGKYRGTVSLENLRDR